MTLAMLQGLYEYHRWANRRLFDVAAALGPLVQRDLGTQFSVPTLKGMFAHLHAADRIWLSRWSGTSPTRMAGDADFPDMAAIRSGWDALEAEQRQFIDELTETDLERVVDYVGVDGKRFRIPLWRALQHVANHATHHRSEIATMLTMASGSPPDTGMATFELVTTGQI